MTFESFLASIQPLVQFLHQHTFYSGLLVFFVVFCEATLIGVVIPGTITMSVFGFLIGSGVIPPTSTIIWAMVGGILGDYISYLWGRCYKDRLQNVWPFRTHPKLLEHGKKFFAKHGGKSVIIGRFVGPMHSMTPMVAGMLNMSQRRFLLAAIPSIILWALAYLLPGILLGALALKLPPKIATQFMVGLVLTIVIIWALVWLAQHFLKRLCRFTDGYIKKLWHYLKSHHSLHWIPKLLSDPRNLDNHQQLTLLLAAFFTAGLFVFTLLNVKHQGFLTVFNVPLYHLLQSLRTNIGDNILLFFTFITEIKAMAIALGLFAIYLAWKRYWYAFFHTLALLAVCYGSIWGIKAFAHIPRPNGLTVDFSKDFSFPSGHPGVGLAIYGFIAMIIARDLARKYVWIPYTIVAILITLVSISRLYLGAHWLTDIFGAVLLSLTILFLITISYRRHHQKIAPIETAIYAAVIFGIVLLAHGIHDFHDQLLNKYWPYFPTKTIDLQTWRSQYRDQHPLAIIPLYRNDRFGHPINAFNIEWRGDIGEIKRGLLEQGWQSYPARFNVQEIFFRLAKIHNALERIPILTQLYNNHPEALLMSKQLEANRPPILLRLWNANIAINGSQYPLWVGVIDYYEPPTKLLNNFKKNKQRPKKFNGAVDELTHYLTGYRFHKIIAPPATHPLEMQVLKWNGEILLIDSKN